MLNIPINLDSMIEGMELVHVDMLMPIANMILQTNSNLLIINMTLARLSDSQTDSHSRDILIDIVNQINAMAIRLHNVASEYGNYYQSLLP